jgi:hypothetical protein
MNAAEVVEDILTHHGVKGMHWGIRKDSSSPRAVTVTDKKKRIATRGGQGFPATESAVRARVIGQQAKKSGTKSLTDQQLRDYASRIQMEQNVKRLQYNEKPAAARFISRVLGRSGEQSAQQAANKATSEAAKKALILAMA